MGDATIGLEGEGPTLLGRPGNWGMVFACNDPVAHDASVCRLFGIDPQKHIIRASELGAGTADSGKIRIASQKGMPKIRIRPATGRISPLKGAEIIDGDACSYCMNYVWTVLFRLSKKSPQAKRCVDVLIGNLIDDSKKGRGKRRILCGDCTLRFRGPQDRYVSGCPPPIRDIMNAISEEAMKEEKQ